MNLLKPLFMSTVMLDRKERGKGGNSLWALSCVFSELLVTGEREEPGILHVLLNPGGVCSPFWVHGPLRKGHRIQHS